MDVWVDEWVDAWMDVEQMDGWINVRMEGEWIDRRMDRYANRQRNRERKERKLFCSPIEKLKKNNFFLAAKNDANLRIFFHNFCMVKKKKKNQNHKKQKMQNKKSVWYIYYICIYLKKKLNSMFL